MQAWKSCLSSTDGQTGRLRCRETCSCGVRQPGHRNSLSTAVYIYIPHQQTLLLSAWLLNTLNSLCNIMTTDACLLPPPKKHYRTAGSGCNAAISSATREATTKAVVDSGTAITPSRQRNTAVMYKHVDFNRGADGQQHTGSQQGVAVCTIEARYIFLTDHDGLLLSDRRNTHTHALCCQSSVI